MPEKIFYTDAEYEAAKKQNIILFLQRNGYELIQRGNEYRSKLHDSLVIRENGSWYWNSQSFGANSPVELYKQILMRDYGYSDEKEAVTIAVKRLAGADFERESPVNAAVPAKARPPTVPLKLPGRHINNDKVIEYLTEIRRLDRAIVDGLIKYNKIYEEKQFHNAVFVAYDSEKRAQNAFLRGTFPDKPFKKDVDLSDKTYAFTLLGFPNSSKVFCFESAIDAISHATLCKQNGSDWRVGHRISLGGVNSGGLKRFLDENPQITDVVFALDNDNTGNKKCEKLMKEFVGKYAVSREKPQCKDFNDDLVKSYEQDCENAEELEL
jgi:hypothetical protein